MDTIVDLYAAQPFWFWAALAAALLAIEVLTGSGWLLWASASAGVTAVVTGFIDVSFPSALLVFALLTLFSSLLARRYLPKPLTPEGADINDNIGRLVGHRGAVVQAFAGRSGRVFIDGKEWAAELDDGEALEAGAAVEVTGVAGGRLRVRRA
jgi:membrane protein implicated in regulation of membrane protease activity